VPNKLVITITPTHRLLEPPPSITGHSRLTPTTIGRRLLEMPNMGAHHQTLLIPSLHPQTIRVIKLPNLLPLMSAGLIIIA
jgi:hypothetical protein